VNSDKIVNAWISKYALTEGIRAKRVQLCGDGMVVEITPDGARGWGYFHKGDWHLDRGDAEAKAEVMRQRKVASVKKQLTRLEALSFSPQERHPGGAE
jgi:mRNA degradation ribonuclease J1/J2